MFGAISFSRVLQVIAVCGIICIISPNSLADDLDKYAPKAFEKENQKDVDAPELPANKVVSKTPEKILVKKLTGLVFVRDPAKVKKSGVNMQGIRVDGYLSESFYSQMEVYIGKPLTVNKMNQMLDQVVRHFRKESTPVVDVFIPEQDITQGAVQVVILEGRIGEMKVDGNKWFSSEEIVDSMRAKPGDIIRGDILAEDVNWLNRNPFRHIDVVLARGKEKGKTDVVLRTTDRVPLRIYGGYENTGSELTGKNRYLFGINWGDVFGLGHIADYQFTTSDKFYQLLLPRTIAHSLRYEVPLALSHTLKISGALSSGKPDMAPFDLETESWQLSANYIWDLPAYDLIRHQVSFGLDYKFSNSDLEFSEVPIFDKKTEVVQLKAGYSSSYPDKWGRTALSLQLTLSPGDLSQHNDNDAFGEYKQGATAEYYYVNLDLSRLTRLPYDLVWDAKMHFQFSDSNLIGSEQMGLGGYASIRGFEEREANGDEGISLINEIRTNSIDISSELDLSFSSGTVQFLGFWDYGRVSNRFEDGKTVLSSVGVGARYQYGANVSLRVDIGTQVAGEDNHQDNSAIAHVGLVVGF